MMSIGISVFVIAALNLFLDFDRIEKGIEQRCQNMEWFGAMGLMILLYVYIEFLRLFSKLSSRN
jgi:uncharacterized YccA/Bax inhibitor family protein